MGKPIPELLSVILLAWLGCLVLSMAWAMARGRIGVSGLFTTDLDGDGYDEFHIERVQLLVISLISIGAYAFSALNAVHTAKAPLDMLPDVPEDLIMLLGASNTLFLTGKFNRTVPRS